MSTVLCIEDEQDLLDDICELMESAGHDVLQASDGQAGLEMILKYKPDLVISDISMPRKNGKELLKEIRTSYDMFEDMPFILLSALSSKEDVLEGIDLGADDYLTKPVDYELLERKVHARLREVERIKKKSDEALLKLFKVMSEGQGLPITTKFRDKVNIESNSSSGTVGISTPEFQLKKENHTTSKRGAKKKKVYGSKVGIKPSRKIKKLPEKSQNSIVSWLETSVSKIINTLFPGQAVTTQSANGEVIICYMDANREKSDERTNQLLEKVGQKFAEEQLPVLKQSGVMSEEDILELSIVVKEPYEAEIDIQDDSLDNIITALQSQSTLENKNKISEITHVDAFVDLLNKRDKGLVMLKLLDQKRRELPIKLYNFHEEDRKTISACFKKTPQ